MSSKTFVKLEISACLTDIHPKVQNFHTHRIHEQEQNSNKLQSTLSYLYKHTVKLEITYLRIHGII